MKVMTYYVEPKKYNIAKEMSSPFKAVMIILLVKNLIAHNPAVTNKTLCGFLKSYRKEYVLTDSILQEAGSCALVELFRTPETNMRYANCIKNALFNQGHIIQIK